MSQLGGGGKKDNRPPENSLSPPPSYSKMAILSMTHIGKAQGQSSWTPLTALREAICAAGRQCLARLNEAARRLAVLRSGDAQAAGGVVLRSTGAWGFEFDVIVAHGGGSELPQAAASCSLRRRVLAVLGG